MFPQLLQDIKKETARIAESEYETVDDLKNELLNTVLPTLEILVQGLAVEFTTVANAMGELANEIDSIEDGDGDDDDYGLSDALIKHILETLNSGITVVDDIQKQTDIEDEMLRKRASNFVKEAQNLSAYLTEELIGDAEDELGDLSYSTTPFSGEINAKSEQQEDGTSTDE